MCFGTCSTVYKSSDSVKYLLNRESPYTEGIAYLRRRYEISSIRRCLRGHEGKSSELRRTHALIELVYLVKTLNPSHHEFVKISAFLTSTFAYMPHVILVIF